MSLVGFKGQNHPQQVGKRGAKDSVDDRATSPAVFDPLHERFRFTLDVAAAAHNTKCEDFYSIEDDGLLQMWEGRVFCNPPYSDIGAWVRKAWAEWDARRSWTDPLELIVMLLPANRTEQGWWQDHVELHLRERRDDFHVEFLRGRLRFIQAGKSSIEPNERPPFGCCLLIWSKP